MLSSDIKSIQHIVSYEFVISPKSRGLDRDIVCRDGTLRNGYHTQHVRTYLYFCVDVALSHFTCYLRDVEFVAENTIIWHVKGCLNVIYAKMSHPYMLYTLQYPVLFITLKRLRIGPRDQVLYIYTRDQENIKILVWK